MGWMQPGELLEVTPSAFRLRHEILHTPERERVVRRAAKERRNNS
jgi:predicted membrane GTPase involved in stress response